MSRQGPEITGDGDVPVSDEIPTDHGANSVGHGHQQPSTRQTNGRNEIHTDWLDLSSTVIEEKETKLRARALESGELTKLKVLFLQGNAGDVGIRATLNALKSGHLLELEKLILWEVSSYNQITNAEEGTDTIAEALNKGLLPILHTMDLTGTLPKLIPARSFLETTKHLIFKRTWGAGRFREGLKIFWGCLVCCTTQTEKNQTLECLRCQFGKLQVYSGDDGIRKIARALKNKPIERLKVLILQQNYIRDRGASSLARILGKGLLPNLEELDLLNNPVGREGARNLMIAFLKNPLLTVRVKLDWGANFSLREKTVAFRESNIRLEHRWDTDGILHRRNDCIVVDEYKQFLYYLTRPHRQGCRRANHRLHLLCHADFRIANGFRRHKVLNDKGVELEGIEMRRRPFIGSSSKKAVQRDLESTDDEEGEVHAQDGVDDSSELTSGDEEKRDETSQEFHSVRIPSYAVANGNNPPSLKRKRRTVKNRIYITSNSCGFVGAAKAHGSQIERSPSKKKQCTWYSDNKIRHQMNTIREELLMLAERKPDEFYNMFGLRQVLLKNPKQKGLYSRVWICKPCFDQYCQQNCESGSGLPKVQPITTNEEVYPKEGLPPVSPKVNHLGTGPSQPGAGSRKWIQKLLKSIQKNVLSLFTSFRDEEKLPDTPPFVPHNC